MMREYLLIITCTLIAFSLYSQEQKPEDTEYYEPVPEIVNPGSSSSDAPSDAYIIFDGTSTSAFVDSDGKPINWIIEGDAIKVKPGAGDIYTKKFFGDCQLHIEWMTPNEPKKEGQGKGNSGVFLQNRYEVQILNNYENKTYTNGQAGSLYKQTPPLVNACRPSGEWQTYDIIFTAPKWNKNGSRKTPGYITVIHNGVVVQNHTEIQGTTEYIGPPKNIKHGKAPIKLQDHSNELKYRNIWIREL